MTTDVILVDDEPDLLESACQTLELAGISVACYASAEKALSAFTPSQSSIFVSDVRMPGMSGTELLDRALAIDPAVPVILITGHGDIPMAIQAIRDGAYDFIEKPFAPEQFLGSVRRALERRRLVVDNRALRDELSSRSALERSLVGKNPAIEKLRQRLTSFAATDADVLILGIEPGFVSAMVFGAVSVSVTWFVMEPILGAGPMASKTPKPAAVAVHDFASHLSFGFGLFLGVFVFP